MGIITIKESKNRKRIKEVREVTEINREMLLALALYPAFRATWPFLNSWFNEVTFETGERGICCYKDFREGEEIEIYRKDFYFLGIPIMEKTYLKKEKQKIPIYFL